MIITRDEAAKLYAQKINALVRYTRRPPKPTQQVDLNCQIEVEGVEKTDLVARAIVKSVRPVGIQFYHTNVNSLKDHGFMSIHGLKRHIIGLYGENVWDSFKDGKVKMTRIKFDYSLNDKQPPPEQNQSKG
jgi:hypothetical protein